MPADDHVPLIVPPTRPKRVACPYCGAKPSDPCWALIDDGLPHGGLTTWPTANHLARIRAANSAGAQ